MCPVKSISYSILPEGLVTEELSESFSRQKITVKEYSDKQLNILKLGFLFKAWIS